MLQAGALDFLDGKRREGRIRKVGFSFHDDSRTLEQMLDAYNWEFVMLQINYYDWITEHAKESYDLLAERVIPCMVMEPVGGGRLAKLPEQAELLLKAKRPNDSIASWAVRFAAGLPNVAVTLSGMSDTQQLYDNLDQFTPLIPLSDHELSLIDEAVSIMKSKNTIPCSGCLYCVDECPAGVAIPEIFKGYNEHKQFENTGRFDLIYFNSTFFPESRSADKCIQCGRCVTFCPQKIDIPVILAEVHDDAILMAIGVNLKKLKDLLVDDALLICFGAGAAGRNTIALLSSYDVHVEFFCDNNQSICGTVIDGVPVISFDKLLELNLNNKVYVIISSIYKSEIGAQLEKHGINVVGRS